MLNKDLQIINDEILTYKQSIYEVENKINLLSFLDSVDNSLKRTLNLDNDELVSKRKYFEQNLRELLDKKLKLIEENESFEYSAKDYTNNLNSMFLNNYLLLLCTFNYEIDTPKQDISL